MRKRPALIAFVLRFVCQDRYLPLLAEAVKVGDNQQISQILDKGICIDVLIVRGCCGILSFSAVGEFSSSNMASPTIPGPFLVEIDF